jgi:hypothetical protein
MQTLPAGADVLAFLGWPSDPVTVTQADQHAASVAMTARAYTRSRGFSEDRTEAEDDICAVIVSAAARSLNNPSQDRSIEAGGFRSQPGYFSGWNLAELAVLHNYRRRSA